MDAQTAQLVAENKKTLAAAAQQPRQISPAMQVSNITDSVRTFQEQQLREKLAAAQAQKADLMRQQEQQRQLDEQISQINASRNKPNLFQRLSSTVQSGTKSAASKIKGLFQRL
jgi:hypothetical protein